jgi:hypothetical protein
MCLLIYLLFFQMQTDARYGATAAFVYLIYQTCILTIEESKFSIFKHLIIVFLCHCSSKLYIIKFVKLVLLSELILALFSCYCFETAIELCHVC